MHHFAMRSGKYRVRDRPSWPVWGGAHLNVPGHPGTECVRNAWKSQGVTPRTSRPLECADGFPPTAYARCDHPQRVAENRALPG